MSAVTLTETELCACKSYREDKTAFVETHDFLFHAGSVHLKMILCSALPGGREEAALSLMYCPLTIFIRVLLTGVDKCHFEGLYAVRGIRERTIKGSTVSLQ